MCSEKHTADQRQKHTMDRNEQAGVGCGLWAVGCGPLLLLWAQLTSLYERRGAQRTWFAQRYRPLPVTSERVDRWNLPRKLGQGEWIGIWAAPTVQESVSLRDLCVIRASSEWGLGQYRTQYSILVGAHGWKTSPLFPLPLPQSPPLLVNKEESVCCYQTACESSNEGDGFHSVARGTLVLRLAP